MTILIYISDYRLLDSILLLLKTVLLLLLLFCFLIGTGKGGKSIWGKKFADELSPALRVSVISFYIHPLLYVKYLTHMC